MEKNENVPGRRLNDVVDRVRERRLLEASVYVPSCPSNSWEIKLKYQTLVFQFLAFTCAALRSIVGDSENISMGGGWVVVEC